MAIVCHDAGAANHILAWLGDTPPADVRAVMEGPARELWRQKFGSLAPILTLEAALSGAATVLSGTGWASDLEHRARKNAAGYRSIAVLDHWTHYRARFERDGELVLPDEYWVTDEDALALANATFPDGNVRLQPNAYLDEQRSRIGPCPSDERLLYLLEPARDDWGRGDPGEFQALDYFIEHRVVAGIGHEVPVVLRPHPSDDPGKYDSWIAAQRALGNDVTLDDRPSLDQAISAATIVAGCQSYAMVVAKAAGRRVVSTLPPWAPPGALPLKGIVALRDLPTP